MSATPPTYDVYPRVPCETVVPDREGFSCFRDGIRLLACEGCRGDGTRSDLDNGTPVEPSHLYDHERRFIACFVPVDPQEER